MHTADILGRNGVPEILALDVGHGRGRVHSFDLDHIAIDSSTQPLHPSSRRTHTACGSAGWVSSRTQSIAGRVLPCNCPEHIVGPRSCPRIESAEISPGNLSKIVNAASVASSSASRYGHFVPRWSSRRGYSNRPILSTFTTIDARLSGVSRIVVGRIGHEPGPAVVYLRIPATPIFTNIESDSDGRMSCPTHLPSAGSSAHTLRDRCRRHFFAECLELSFTAAPNSIRTPNWHRTVSRETAPAPDRLEGQSKCCNFIRERTSRRPSVRGA